MADRSLLLYYYVVTLVPDAGKHVAKFIDFLNSAGCMSFKNLTLVGYGLGAHVAGYAGKNVRKGRIDVIIGLDPVDPGFEYDNCKTRLCRTDATYVESIQTNGGNMFQLGFSEPIGKVAFYPDGGEHQLPCFGVRTIACSHAMSYKYYAIAIRYNNFCAIKCANYKTAQAKKCRSGYKGVRMGFPKKHNESGVYFVPIQRKYPYGRCHDFIR